MAGSEAFFQVAVGLIPALLFGGALAERRSAGDSPSRPPAVAMVIGMALIAGVAAEIIAIRGAIDPSVGRLELRYLVFVVVAGTVGIALWTAVPWFSHVAPAFRTTGRRRRPLAALVLVLVALLGGAQLAISQSLDRASARDQLADASRANLAAQRALNAAEQGVTSARAALLSVGRRSDARPRQRLDSVLARHLEALDEATEPVLSEDLTPGAPDLTRSLAESRLDAAFRNLNAATGELHQALDAGEPKVSASDRTLLQLALDRLRSAEAERLTAKTNYLGTRERFEEACAEATFLTCQISRSR